MSEDRKWAWNQSNNYVGKKEYQDGWERIFGQKENSCPKGYKKCINCDPLCDYRQERQERT